MVRQIATAVNSWRRLSRKLREMKKEKVKKDGKGGKETLEQ